MGTGVRPSAGPIPQVGVRGPGRFRPGNRLAALLDGRGIRIHDLWTGKQLAAYSAPDVTCDQVDGGCLSQSLVFSPDGRTLATGHQDGTVMLWKVPQPTEADVPEIAPAEHDTVWADLGSESPIKARTAVERLGRFPDTALALLRARFSPTPTLPAPALAALIKNLDSDEFATREEATRKTPRTRCRS